MTRLAFRAVPGWGDHRPSVVGQPRLARCTKCDAIWPCAVAEAADAVDCPCGCCNPLVPATEVTA